MKLNDDFSGISGKNNDVLRDLHASDAKITQTSNAQIMEAPETKKFQALLAGLATVTLVGFLVVLFSRIL